MCTKIADVLSNMLCDYETDEDADLEEYALELVKHLQGCRECLLILAKIGKERQPHVAK